jgi:glycosyltransferase involved in cell wall biosynthesis
MVACEQSTYIGITGERGNGWAGRKLATSGKTATGVGISVPQQGAKPTVALVAHDIHDGGGMEHVCAELIRRAYRDYDFVAVAATVAPELRPLVREWLPVRVPRRPFALKFGAFWLRASLRLRSLDVDIIHTVGAIVPNRIDVAALHFCHAGFVRAERRLASRSAPVIRRANTAMARLLAIAGERWCYRLGRMRAFAAVSAGVGDEVSQHFPGIPVHITPNGVDRDRFRPDARAREEVRRELGVGGAPVAVFVGGDWDRKGLAVVLRSIAYVQGAGAELRLWVIGRGDQNRFEALASRLGVQSAISFLGPRNDVERLLAAADVFVFPSSYEAHPLAALEAAACGLPIVATRVHGIVDLVAGAAAGILVDRNAESVADALVRLAEDSDLRARLGRAALERSSQYSWDASAAAVMDLYRSLLGEPAAVIA